MLNYIQNTKIRQYSLTKTKDMLVILFTFEVTY